MIQRIKNKVNVLRADSHIREVTRGMSHAFVLKVVGAGLAFGFNVAVARLLGAEGAGLYFLALSVVAIGSVIGRVGLDNALLRFIATYATHEEWGKVRGVYALGIRMAIAFSGVVTLIVFFAAPWVTATLFDKPELAGPLRWMSFSILPFALLNLQAESLKGLKRVRDAMVVQSIGLPLISLLLIYPLSQLADVTGVIWAYSIGAVAAAVLGAWIWYSVMSKYDTSATPILKKDLLKSCKPLFVVSLMNRALMPWAPIMLLGIWASSEEVGIFGVATRIALLVSFMLVAINNILAPKFAELIARGDWLALGKTARRSALLITILASPLFFVLIFQGAWVMSMFGEQFVNGAVILSILAVGQLINVACGSVGYLLMMSGNERVYRNITIVFALIQLLLVVVLSPEMGGVGAAIATCLALAGMNLAAAYAVYSRLGIVTIPVFWRTL